MIIRQSLQFDKNAGQHDMKYSVSAENFASKDMELNALNKTQTNKGGKLYMACHWNVGRLKV